MKTNFWGIGIDLLTSDEALKNVKEYLHGNSLETIYFINAHCYNISKKNEDYQRALNSATLLLNDGIGMKIGLRLAHIKEKENMNGTDFIPKIIKLATSLNKRIYLLGGKAGTAERAAQNIKKIYPSCNIIGKRDGYFDVKENESVIKDIIDKQTDLIIVGMGVPYQELWLEKNKEFLINIKLGVAGGAILDFLAGNVNRAPVIIRKIKMEWLFRLIQEPKRLWKRYIFGNIIFFYNILSNKIFT